MSDQELAGAIRAAVGEFNRLGYLAESRGLIMTGSVLVHGDEHFGGSRVHLCANIKKVL